MDAIIDRPGPSPTTLMLRREAMRFRKPFRIAGYLLEAMPAIVATITRDGASGRGEAAGVYYLDDGPDHIERVIERVRPLIEDGIDRRALLLALPPGGARNALDCALWELESHRRAVPVWSLAGVTRPRPLTTTFTLPADTPEVLLADLAEFADATAIKLKLDGDLAADIERVRVVRRARPDVWLGVDANQGYDGTSLDALVAALVDSNVALLEQPIRRGTEALLDGWRSPIPLAADESILDLAELEALGERFDVVNIKLDKCGGLTEALLMEVLARRMGLRVMVGNMGGSTLSAAPAFVLAQSCDIVDLDGPYFLPDDMVASTLYAGGRIMVPPAIWGNA